MIKIIVGDCRKALSEVAGDSIASCVTDPPYELGFMGKAWDKTGVAYDVSVWREVLRVLKPGGHLLAFGGTRTYHRLACAVEDAGFEIRDCIQWLYGSGFPKSQNVSKMLDKRVGTYVPGRVLPSSRTVKGPMGFHMKEKTASNPQSDAAKQWEGWGTALKPANEPIVVARKPLSEKTVAQNVVKWGTGALNIDASRIPTVGKKGFWPGEKYGDHDGVATDFNRGKGEESANGRWPANVVLDEEAGKILDGQAGVRKSGAMKGVYKGTTKSRSACFGEYGCVERNIEASSGGASRFFYCAKVSQKERNAGCNTLAVKFDKEKGNGIRRVCENCGASQVVSDGDRVCECPTKSWVLPGRRNNHPTVKPVSLMKYLIKLVTPDGGTVLDPFMGSGSTGCAASENLNDFIGIEMSEEYAEIARARIAARDIF